MLSCIYLAGARSYWMKSFAEGAESVIVCMSEAAGSDLAESDLAGSDLAGSDLALVGEATDPPPS